LIPLSRNFIKLRFLLLIHNPVKEIGIGLGIGPIWDLLDLGFRIADYLDCGLRIALIFRLEIVSILDSRLRQPASPDRFAMVAGISELIKYLRIEG